MREETSETNQCEAKAQLQQDIKASFDKLKTAWAKKIEVIKEEEEVDPKPEDVDLEDLLNPDDDDIMSLSSESDDDEQGTA